MTDNIAQKRNENFLKLLAQSENVLRSYLRALVEEQSQIAEVMQNVFIIGWRKYDQFSGSESDFTKWLCVIGKYEALKYRKSLSRDRHVLSEELVYQIADEGEEDISSHSMWIEQLEHCMEKLSPNNRELINEAYSPHCSIKELAERDNKSPNALYQKLNRIRNQLATCMDKTAPITT